MIYNNSNSNKNDENKINGTYEPGMVLDALHLIFLFSPYDNLEVVTFFFFFFF